MDSTVVTGLAGILAVVLWEVAKRVWPNLGVPKPSPNPSPAPSPSPAPTPAPAEPSILERILAAIQLLLNRSNPAPAQAPVQALVESAPPVDVPVVKSGDVHSVAAPAIRVSKTVRLELNPTFHIEDSPSNA